MKTSLLELALFTLFIVHQAIGFPGGSPHCNLAQPAPGGTFTNAHLNPEHSGVTRPIISGSLADNGILVSIDGCILEEDGAPFEVKVFDVVKVTISRSSMWFRGVLARFDIDQAIGLLEGEEDLQISSKCDDDGVS